MENSTQIKFDKEEEYQRALDSLNDKSWYEEYEYWADNEDAIREELHHNQYEDRLYYENGDVYVEPLNEIA